VTEVASGQRFALKVLMRPGDDDQTARFLAEGRLLERIRHPNVLRVHAVKRVMGRPSILADHAASGSLRDLLARAPLLPVDEAVRIALDCLDGLSLLHRLGVVHRDLKPDNILLDAAGRALVADLGLARLPGRDHQTTGPGHFVGTPLYASPEQIRCGPVGAASDLYIHATGLILYRMLAGRLPFEGCNAGEVCIARLRVSPTPLGRVIGGVPDAIAAAVHRALAYHPIDRQATVEALARDLRTALQDARGHPPSRSGACLESLTTAA
jgi:serine/threonine-protein kinase